MRISKNYLVYFALGFAFLSLLFSCKPNDDSDVEEIPGCTDSLAFNYNPNATVDDGLCEPVLYGCICECSENYDSTANTDNGSCILDRDKFLGTYEVHSACYGVYHPGGDTVYYTGLINIIEDASDFCKLVTMTTNGDTIYSYSVSDNNIIIPHSRTNPSNGWIEERGGTAVLQNDTIFLYTYYSFDNTVWDFCNSIWVKQ